MIIKTYKAYTHISINVVLPEGKNVRISFTPLSNGSSLFTTRDEDIQKGIEGHYNFGKLFKLHNQQEFTIGERPTAIAAEFEPTQSNTESSLDTSEESFEGSSTRNEKVSDSAKIKVTVTDLASAKEYLADNFGLSRTSLRSLKSILEQAAAHGIEFEGL